MEAKLLPSSCQITTVRPLERDWRDKAVATQLEMEEVWQALEREREGRYRMIPLSPDSLDNEDDGSGGGWATVCRYRIWRGSQRFNKDETPTKEQPGSQSPIPKREGRG